MLRADLVSAYIAESRHIVRKPGIHSSPGTIPLVIVASFIDNDTGDGSAPPWKGHAVTSPCGGRVRKEIDGIAMLVQQRHRIFVDDAGAGIVNRDESTLCNRNRAVGERKNRVYIAVAQFIDRLRTQNDISGSPGCRRHDIISFQAGNRITFRINAGGKFAPFQ